MTDADTQQEAPEAAPPLSIAQPTSPTRPPDVRYALRLIMLAGGEGRGGSHGAAADSLLGRRTRIE